MKSQAPFWVVVAISLLLGSCGGGAPPITGNWTFTFRDSLTGNVMTASGSLTQQGKTITGIFTLSGVYEKCGAPDGWAPILGGGISSAGSVGFIFDNELVLTGTLNATRTSGSGSYTDPLQNTMPAPCLLTGSPGNGTWTASKQP